jgi:hypothetical protein
MVLLLVISININGCVLLPIPTPAHGGYGLITDEELESLKPGQATRGDVLLRLGDPSERIDDDRFFIYQWERTHGYLLWAIVLPAPGAGVGDVVASKKLHFLAIEFTADNRLKRSKFIDPWLFQDPRKHLEEVLAEWGTSAAASE